jgi:hypothetical protein
MTNNNLNNELLNTDTQELKVSDIVWDVDGDTTQEDLELPSEVFVPQDTEDIADYLSNKYGWCVVSFYVQYSIHYSFM